MKAHTPRSAAFTVIELLVAATISLLLAGLLIVVMRSSLSIWQRTQDRATANVQVKVALDYITRDLQAAIFREGGEATMAIDIVAPGNLPSGSWRQDYAGATKPDTVYILNEVTDTSGRFSELSRFGRAGVWLRFLTTNVRTGGGAPAMVGYQINRRPISGSATASSPPAIRYSLFRVFLDPAVTFGRAKSAGGYFADQFDGDFAVPGTDDALCDNVVDFGVWCYRQDNDGELTPLYPSANPRSFRAAGNQVPNVVDVMLRVLTDSGAAQLEQMESGRVLRPAEFVSDTAWWWAVVSTESRVYCARILLRHGGGA